MSPSLASWSWQALHLRETGRNIKSKLVFLIQSEQNDPVWSGLTHPRCWNVQLPRCKQKQIALINPMVSNGSVQGKWAKPMVPSMMIAHVSTIGKTGKNPLVTKEALPFCPSPLKGGEAKMQSFVLAPSFPVCSGPCAAGFWLGWSLLGVVDDFWRGSLRDRHLHVLHPGRDAFWKRLMAYFSKKWSLAFWVCNLC